MDKRTIDYQSAPPIPAAPIRDPARLGLKDAPLIIFGIALAVIVLLTLSTIILNHFVM